jgi:hypothetical protein
MRLGEFGGRGYLASASAVLVSGGVAIAIARLRAAEWFLLSARWFFYGALAVLAWTLVVPGRRPRMCLVWRPAPDSRGDSLTRGDPRDPRRPRPALPCTADGASGSGSRADVETIAIPGGGAKQSAHFDYMLASIGASTFSRCASERVVGACT